MTIRHPIVSAVLVVIAGTIATRLHHIAAWIRSYDPSRRYE